ncbi:MAG: hypothetical protein COB36_14865 [Alphaproteobacteria bacterium]|nr:MAG: hypothetical protein COB36_14865 [Alphaproteobacteria bacterium]
MKITVQFETVKMVPSQDNNGQIIMVEMQPHTLTTLTLIDIDPVHALADPLIPDEAVYQALDHLYKAEMLRRINAYFSPEVRQASIERATELLDKAMLGTITDVEKAGLERIRVGQAIIAKIKARYAKLKGTFTIDYTDDSHWSIEV